MFKTFIRGIVFGAGFSISLIIIMFIAKEILINDLESKYDNPTFQSNYEEWHKLSDDEQLKKATAIAIIRYSDSEEGSKIGTVEQIYTDDSVTLNIKVGDSYPSLKYYPRGDSLRERSGVLVVFRDSPPIEQSTLYLYDDRVAAYGDMPVEIAIKKFKEN
jgi:hypothetical protein